MNKFVILLTVISKLLTVISLCQEETTIGKYRRIIQDAQKNPEKIIIEGDGIDVGIGDIVRRLGRRQESNGPEENEIFREAQATLLSIPGHAEYYASRMSEIYEKSLAEAERYNRSHLSVGHEWRFCLYTMSYLPSPETVRVLGDMLDDMRSMDRSGSQPKDWTPNNQPWPPAAWHAANTLTSMGLSGAPMKRFMSIPHEEKIRMTAEEFYNANIEPWRLWYAQVKAGTRTFRFKDDPQEYNLDGPVGRAIESMGIRPVKSLTVSNAAVEKATGSGFSWPILLAAMAVCGTGAWLALRGKRSE